MVREYKNMTIIYHKEFWPFYKLNRKEIHSIVGSFYKKYNIPTEYNEVLNQLLIKMYSGDFLRKFDKNKASLKTALINRIRWDLLDIIQGYKAANLMPTISLNEVEPISSYDSIEEQVIAEDLSDRFENRLSEDERQVYSLKMKGYKRAQIAEMLSCAVNLADYYVDKIKMKAVKFFQKEGINACV
jgi:ribosomal protein S17E